MRKYSTIDFLPDLTAKEMSEAIRLTYDFSSPNSVEWDFEGSAFGIEPNAILHSIYSFDAAEGATYDIFSVSFLDPFLLILYDQNGNVIEVNSEFNDPADFILDDIPHGVDHLVDWVAPYSGIYYVDASWHQDVDNTFYSLTIYEDIDTISSEPIAAKAGRIFNWAEDEYSLLFPNHPESEMLSGFNARLYSNGTVLGEKDGNIYFYDGGAGGTDSIVVVGAVSDFLPQAIADGF